MFTANLASGTSRVQLQNNAGLWATDSTGQTRLLVREGDLIGDKYLRKLSVLGAVAGSPGQRRAWTSGDTSAQVIYRATFTDGSTAIVSTAVP
jgi:hypothetical protein